MPEFLDPESGEVVHVESPAQAAVVGMLTPVELFNYEPVTPEQIEALIVVLSNRLESAVGVITVLYEEVHRAQEKYQLTFSSSLLSAPHTQISFAREYAHVAAAAELETLNLAKEKLKYAEELQKALTSKLYGYLNINKSVTAQFMGASRR